MRNFPVVHKRNPRKLHLHSAGKSPKNVVTGELGLCKPDMNVIHVNYIHVRPENRQKTL